MLLNSGGFCFLVLLRVSVCLNIIITAVDLTTMAATHEGKTSLPLDGDPPTGAVTDGAHAIADLVPSKELAATDAPNSSHSPNSPVSETLESKIEGRDEASSMSKGKVALIMSALCVRLAWRFSHE